MKHNSVLDRWRRWSAATALALAVSGVVAGSPAWADPPVSDAVADARAQALVAQMTLQEKSALLYGYGTKTVGDQNWQVYVKGNDRLGIPDMTQGDAPGGIVTAPAAVTQMPTPIALAATWSRTDAQTYGDTLGAEARALGVRRATRAERRHGPRSAPRPRLRDLRRGSVPVGPDRDPVHPRVPESPGHLRRQALRRQRGREGPHRHERAGRRAHVARAVHAAIPGRRRRRRDQDGDVLLQQDQRGTGV